MPDPFISVAVTLLVLILGWFIFRPEIGWFWEWQRAQKLTARILKEDALKHIHQHEIHGDKPSVNSLAGALKVSPDEVTRIISNLEAHELLVFEGGDIQLTAAGREYALRMIRAHRLYERYLADETSYEETAWHDRAERFEHTLTTDEANALAARLGNPTHDPHGDPIPTASGHMIYPEHILLTNMEIDQPARIVHLEDEPEGIYAQIVSEGLHVGQVVRLLESSSKRVRFWADGDEHIVAPIVAANIAVAKLSEVPQQAETRGEALSSLKPGQSGQVVQLSHRIRGAERRRLMDMGVLPGTKISNEMDSAAGDPSAYRIRDAVIALRKSQADLILIDKQEEPVQ
ncbi:MAG TPA: metal-dependent transcriptional regulator [Anaerolineales bacterium]|nr:metal-dependent transcriptional regulator [Anaerolineales bacterium]